MTSFIYQYIPAAFFILDGLETIVRTQMYLKNNPVIQEFRNDLKQLNQQKKLNYGIVTPMYKNPDAVSRTLDNLINNIHISPKNIFAVDDYSNDNDKTKNIALYYGVTALQVTQEEKDVRKVRALKKGVDELLKLGKDYVICLDSDSFISSDVQDIELAIQEMQALNLDAMAACVLPKIDQTSNLLERIQYSEYKQAMHMFRGSMYSLKKQTTEIPRTIEELREKYTLNQASQLCVSGAFGIFRVTTLSQILHEINPYGCGDDFETTLRHLAKKLKIGYHNQIIVETEAPKKLKDLLKQRHYWAQYATSFFLDSQYIWNIFKKENSLPNYDAGGIALRTYLLKDVYSHPFKLLSMPAFVANTPLFLSSIGAYCLASLYCSSQITTKKLDWPAELLLPFYRIMNLIGPLTTGYTKQFLRIFNSKERKKNNQSDSGFSPLLS